MYSRDLSKKVKSTMGTRAVRGEYMGAFAPYGYLKKPEIARFLNERGTPTCMEHFQAIELKRKSYREKQKSCGPLLPLAIC